MIGGAEAERIGLATAVHPSDHLWDEALALAATIAGMDPKGVALTLAHLRRSEDLSRDQALRWAQLAPNWLGVSIDMRDKDEKVLGGTKRSR